MINPKYFLERLKDVAFRDYLSFFQMIMALLLVPLYKKKYSGMWLICEEPYEAKDNGYHFFKYMCECHKNQKCYYAIKKKSKDFHKVTRVGKVIGYGSIKHWLAYFLCEYNISSQKGGKPNAAVCQFMELNKIFKTQNVFLQHGIIINDCRWLYADRSCFKFFLTSTNPEKEFVENRFGYEKGIVQLTGLSRFDALHDATINQKQIVIMPTWRYWFVIKSKETEESLLEFRNSEYFKKWIQLLNSSEMEQLAKKYALKIIFYPHRNLQRFIHDFSIVKSYITVASQNEFDIQKLLKSSALMVTDYSSVFFDMVYMKKPVVFYQFDEQKFRDHQYKQGYFNYHSNPFGNSFDNYVDVVREIERLTENGYSISKEAEIEHKEIFKYWDTNNSERIYHLLTSKSDRV